MWPGRAGEYTTWAGRISAWSCMRCFSRRLREKILSGSCIAIRWSPCGPGCGDCWGRMPAESGSGSSSRRFPSEPGRASSCPPAGAAGRLACFRAEWPAAGGRIIDLHAVAGTFSYVDLENLARRHDPDLDLKTILDHLAGVGVSGDDDFAEYGLDEPRITDLRNWVTGWYDDLGSRLATDPAADETSDDP